jgi:hypothetical protein
MAPLIAVKQTCGTPNQKFAKPLLECTRRPDRLGSKHHLYSNLLGHLDSLKNDLCVSGRERSRNKKVILQLPAHTRLPDGQQDPGPQTAPIGQHWRPPGQGTYPGSRHCCLLTRPLRALRTGTSSTWRVRGTMWRFPLSGRRRIGVGPL